MIILFLNAGYRDDSLDTVKKNRDDYEMPLKILSYDELYGWSMDRIVQQVFNDLFGISVCSISLILRHLTGWAQEQLYILWSFSQTSTRSRCCSIES